MPDVKPQAGLFPPPPPPALPVATQADRVDLLRRLRERRRELVDAYALAAGESPPPSSLWPLVYVETAIRAVEAVLDAELERGP